VIGPGAVVHAHAHVHRSVLGANVEVGDHAVLVGCTLAERVHVLRASYFALCAAMPAATLANYKAQLSLFGREVFLTSSAMMIDAKLEGDVSVEHEGSFVSVGTPFLGSCLGHRVTIGASVAILPGRAIQNGQTVVGPPEQFVARAPGYPEGALLTVRNGRIEPV
jgi:carbonic anhydrase/acetyltransferase-like protein (isoleucine patch superfamily)